MRPAATPVPDGVPASPLAFDVEFLALKAFAAGTRSLNQRLRPLRLHARSYAVLSVACADQPMTQRELASLLELDPSQIVGLVDDLAARGLVERRTAAHDARVRIVRALPSGRALWEQAVVVARENERQALAALGEEGRDALRSLLRKVVFPDGAEA